MYRIYRERLNLGIIEMLLINKFRLLNNNLVNKIKSN